MNFAQIRAKAESSALNRRDRILISVGQSGFNNDKALFVSIKDRIESLGITADVISTGPSGYYDLEPILIIEKQGRPAIIYHNITTETASELVIDYITKDNPRPDLALCSLGDGKIEHIPPLSTLPVFSLQNRIALRNCGYIDPENIDHYILCAEGYKGLSRALQMDQEDVIRELKKSGLRGRGGAGYPTADKWRACHETEESRKYLVCNAVDADPLAHTARLLLESDPHCVLEGVLIGAYAVGAYRCLIYTNSEFSLALTRLKNAMAQLREYGLLGSNILDTPFSTEIEIKQIPSSLVAGEETALLRSLEEKQAMPYPRPPYPAVIGLSGKPTVIDSLETLANVSAIFQKRPEWFCSIGTEGSKGSKVITLAGDVLHKYTIEVPFGTTLRTIIEKVGGGVPDRKNLKAVQFGGPTGDYFASGSLDIQIDFELLAGKGSILGSGTIEVFDSGSCTVEVTRDKMAYLHDQSCGKCVFCREGTLQMADILEDFTQSQGKPEDLDLMIELGEGMKTGCICGLGQTAANPVLSSIELFRSEYEDRLKGRKVPL